MALILPGQALLPRMDPQSRSSLAGEISERLSGMQQEYAPLLRAISAWWNWYHAVPRLKEKNFPFRRASNVVVPLIGISVDSLSARELSQITAAAPEYWSARTENEGRVEVARNMKRYVNWQADGNDFSLKHVLSDCLPEKNVTGRTVLALHYAQDVRPMFFGRNGGKIGWRMVEFARGPKVEHVPAEQILWDRRCRIGDAPFVARYHEWTWNELRSMAKLDDAWSRTEIEAVKGMPGPDEFVETRRIMDVKAEIEGRDTSGLEGEIHGVWEIHVDWSMIGNRFEVPGDETWGGEQVPLVLHLHRRSGKILRLTGSPYLLPHKPFIDLRWRHGKHGVAKAMEQFQEMMTTTFNQAFDAQTRANALWGKTREPKHNRQPIDPSRWLLVSAMDEVEPMNFGSNPAPNMALLTALNTMSERWMGHNDPLMGRETRSGGHPAPATSTLALLEQSGMMSSLTDEVNQAELGRLGLAIAMLDQQFETNEGGKLAQVLGPEDAAKAGEFIFPEEPLPGNYYFDMVALSRTENPDSQMRRALMVAQAYQNYVALAVQAAQAMSNPQAPPQVKETFAIGMDAYGKLLARFLDAANIDEGEDYLVRLENLGIDSRNSFAQFLAQQRAAQAAAAGGAPGGGPGALSAAGSLVGAGNGADRGAGRLGAGIGVLQ